MEDKIEGSKMLLQQISSDHSVPKNIRRAAKQAFMAVTEDDPPEVRANFAISILDEISQDPNCPLFARTKIWNILSLLETISSESQE
ncbi:MAG: UPF0147 family protein [Candidatus Hodarchaeales archaeon]|jgi:uncharacterized protein (UPF0147 family)